MKSAVRFGPVPNCIPEKANIGHLDLIPIPHSHHSVSLKNTEMCAALQRDASSVHQDSIAVMVDFLDIGE
ncbi:hypothetical protein TNCV_4539511 [Trichonephila clavipes]|nr:hypothetical protein TNCV_4539511 [Trichonephila clavipes]